MSIPAASRSPTDTPSSSSPEKLALANELFRAARQGDMDRIVAALAKGADPRWFNSISLRFAAGGGYDDCVRLLLPLSSPLDDDSAALHGAALYGRTECVRMLIPFTDPASDNSLALRWAATEGHADCVQLLLPVSDPLATGKDCLTPAELARKNDHPHIAAMIDAFCERSALDQATVTPRPPSAFKPRI